jgi:hypothetical protein
MRHDRDTALDQCLAWLRAGNDIEGCLEHYPEYAEELRPLLTLVVEVGRVTIPAVPATARAAGERRMLAAFARSEERRAQTHPVVRHAKRLRWALVPGRPGSMRSAWPAVVALLFVLLVGISGVTVAASVGALPGDALYPIKLASQRWQLALTFNPAAHGLLADRYDTQRRLDVQAALKGGRQVTVEFQGVLQETEPGLWMVSGLPVILQSSTAVIGQPHVGALVHVHAHLPGDGKLIALRVDVVSEATLSPTPVPGPTDTRPPATSTVPSETPTPTETSEPAPPQGETETPVPSDTPAGVGTPATETPESTDTPQPAEMRDDTDVPALIDAPESDDAPEPAETREREVTGDPSETADPEETPEHEESLEDGHSPEDGERPEDDDGPVDRETPEGDDDPEVSETPEPKDTPDD